MNSLFRSGAIIALAATATTAFAAPKFAVYPMQTGDEVARFRQGVPTLDLETEDGAIQVTPLPMDHGSLSFGIGVYNKGKQAANFGIENFKVHVGAQDVAVLTKDQLVSKAKNRAMWTAIALAAVAGATAAAVANAHTTQTYRSNTYTPWGNVHHIASYRDNTLGTVAAGAAVGGGVAGIVGIQNRLDYTVANLNDEIVQTTTVEPDASYGGRVVFSKIKAKTLPQDVRIDITWNGRTYPFAFRIAKPGQDVPAPYVMRTSAPPAAVPAGSVPPQTPPTSHATTPVITTISAVPGAVRATPAVIMSAQ